MKKKRIIIGLMLIVLLVLSIKPLYAYYEQKQEENRLAQEPYFTEYKLSRDELGTMIRTYYVNEEPHRYTELDKELWPDYSFYTIEATKDTEMAVAVLNYCLFDNFMESDVEGLKRAKEYGFSPTNQITVDWVMTHPKDAVYIMYGMWEKGDIFDDYQSVKKIYDEKINKLVID